MVNDHRQDRDQQHRDETLHHHRRQDTYRQRPRRPLKRENVVHQVDKFFFHYSRVPNSKPSGGIIVLPRPPEDYP
jgi:hypothetical protein